MDDSSLTVATAESPRVRRASTSARPNPCDAPVTTQPSERSGVPTSPLDGSLPVWIPVASFMR